MFSDKVIRWSGLLGVLVGIIVALLDTSVFVGIFTLGDTVVVELALNFLVLFPLMGLYARQSAKAGILGLVGFVAVFSTHALAMALASAIASVAPVQAAFPHAFDVMGTGPFGVIAVLVVVLGTLGWPVFGIATLRVGLLPRWGAVLVTIGMPLGSVQNFLLKIPGPIGGVLLGLGLAWLGYALWSDKPAHVMQSQPAHRAEEAAEI
jgi:hypothetical protein